MKDAAAAPLTEIDVTHAVFQALLHMTGGDPDLHTDKKKSLVRAVHAARLINSGRWVLPVTDEDIRSIYVHLEGYLLNRPHLRTRLMNVMIKQSPLFAEIVQAAQEKAEDAE